MLPLHKGDLKKSANNSSASSGVSSTALPIELVVRFANGSPDIVIPVDRKRIGELSTRYIRREIRQRAPQLSRNRLKLIHNGKVLLSHTDFSKELKFLADAEQQPSQKSIRIYVHCIVGEELSREVLAKEEELEHQPEKSTTEAPKGFDRLLSQGFSAQDVAELRQQFQQIHGSSLNNQSPEALRELEDRWIDSTVNNEIDEFPANLNPASVVGDGAGAGRQGGGGVGSSDADARKELLLGVTIGYFLGVFALFLIKLEVGGFFNKRTRMAVIAGVFVNLSFGASKAWS